MFKITKNSLAVSLSVAMLATMVTIPQVASAATSTQLSGLDRYKTSLEIVQAGWEKDSSENVIIASGENKNMADSLAAAPLAYKMGEAPILLTKTDSIPAGVLTELERLGVTKITIVGGDNAVSPEVEAELKATGVTVERVSGADRFETSLEIAKAAFGTNATEVVIANGLASSDALSVSAIAAYKSMPVLLVNNRTGLTAEQKAYIAGTTVYAVGGTTVLSESVVGNATRLSGANRYETNAAILAKFAPDYSKIFLAKGTDANLVDALVGSAYAAKGNNPIVLVDAQDGINAKLVTEVTNNISANSEIVRLGGKVTTSAADAVEAMKSQELAVESVIATNSKTIEVTFTNAIDPETLKSAGVDVIKVTPGTNAVASGNITHTLSTDGKTLTLKADDFFKGDYTVAVPFETVKGISGEYVNPINKVITVNDITAPVLASVTTTIKSTLDNVKLITLTFNEDIKTLDNVKINGVNYSPELADNKATVAVDLDATKAYDVTVVNATDAVGNLSDIQTAPLAITVDNIAPSITSVVATGENTLKVTVSKALESDILSITGKIGSYNTDVIDSVVVNPDNNKEYVVTLNNSYLFKNGNTDTVTLTIAKEVLVDTIGNMNAAAITKTVAIAKDATAPAVMKVENTVEAGKVTGFTVTYNEAVQTIDSSKVSVVNSNGEIKAFSAIATAAVGDKDTQVVFTLEDGVAVEKYGFDFAEGFVTDIAITPNKSAKSAFIVDVTDAATPVETAFTIADATIASNVITVDFDAKVKATGTGSALNPASYQINGTVLPSNTVIEFSGAITDPNYQKEVVITLPDGFVKDNDTKAIFRVVGVQTLDNKVSNAFIKLVEVTDNTAPEAKSFVATELTTITVTYSEAIEDIATSDVTDEVKLFDNTGASVEITGSTVIEGKLVLTVDDSSDVAKLTTVVVDESGSDIPNIMDATGNIQKSGLTINK